MSNSLSDLSMRDLFRMEVENQRQVLTTGLLALERNPTAAEHLEACMRAAHSLKGAARIVELDAAVTIAHQMENMFVAAQQGTITLEKTDIDELLKNLDALVQIAGAPEIAAGTAQKATGAPKTIEDDAQDRALRVTVENLNRLLGLSGESLVASRWLEPFVQSLGQLKRMLEDPEKNAECRQFLSEHLDELETFNRQTVSLAHRLYDQALACRMRPFTDGVQAFPRMVRDLAHTLGKSVRLEIIGETTQVDRDVLEKLEAPLIHLLRNAVDHGIGSPQERKAAGKPSEGCIRLEARHHAGMLQVSVSDDGKGVSVEQLRETIVARGLTTEEMVQKLSDAELFEFLFLPGFTVKETVTEISGRGVGLDAVHNVVKQLHGNIRVFSSPGQGTRFQMHLPLTLSVARTLVTEIGGEPYAIPLAQIASTLSLPRESVELLEGRQHFNYNGRQIGLVAAHQVLGGTEPKHGREELPVIVIGNQQAAYGLVVDRFLGIRELVVQPLDVRLGTIKDISAGSLLDDGSPVLIVDVEDLVLSVEKLVTSGNLDKVRYGLETGPQTSRKRVLVVDDSLTVRELERKLIESGGYEVEVAVDGADGWNAVRTGHFNLVVTDVDMPRMDGIEFVQLIKKDPRLQSLPVMIVSYKDREEDRSRGLEAGADFYLTKGSFHDETLLHAVVDLIGTPEA